MPTDNILHRKPRQYTVGLVTVWLQTVLSTFVHISGAQVILPGRSPRIYLPARCDGFTLNGLKHGVLESLSNGGRYHPNADCKVFFNVERNQIVHFDFEDFSLQNRVRGRCLDYVQFFADEAMEFPLTEPLCGQSLPDTISTNASTVVLYFHSNDKHETKGFRLRFRRSPLHCDGSDPECYKSEVVASGRRLTYFLRLPALFLVFPALLVGIVLLKHFS